MTSKPEYVDIAYDRYCNTDFSEYFEFIEKNKLPTKIKFKTAAHHILPRWAFPEYGHLSKFPWNKAILTHENHLIAHFILWKTWRHYNNATPLMLMTANFDLDAMTDEYISDFKQEFQQATEAHSRSVSIKHMGKTISQKALDCLRGPKPQLRGFVSAIRIHDNEPIRITTEEYAAGKDTLYKRHQTGKPAWNSGKSVEKNRGKLNAIHIPTGELIRITTEEYAAGKDTLYKTPLTGLSLEKKITPVRNKITGECSRVSLEEFESNPEIYEHPTAKLTWINDGVSNRRINIDKGIPLGFVIGRLSDGLVGRKMKTLTCEKCGFVSGSGNFKRYHVPKCARDD